MKSQMDFWSRMFAELATRSTALEFQSKTNVHLDMSLCLPFSPENGNLGILCPLPHPPFPRLLATAVRKLRGKLSPYTL